jgi:hypothetical protein
LIFGAPTTIAHYIKPSKAKQGDKQMNQVKCQSCNALVINGHPTHEQGCTDQFDHVKEQIEKLKDYLNELAKAEVKYQTEHQDSIDNIKECIFKNWNCKDYLNDIPSYDRYREDLAEVIEFLLEHGIRSKDIDDKIMELVEAENGTMACEYNYIDSYSFGEIEIDYKGNYEYKELIKGLSEIEINAAFEDCEYYTSGGYLYINTDDYLWFTVDPEKLLNEFRDTKPEASIGELWDAK